MREDLKDAKILIVDDHKPNIILLKEVLRSLGYECVLSTLDPREVKTLLFSFQPDILLLDLNMPYLSGYDILEQIQGTPELNSRFMPVLVLTSDDAPQAKKRSLSEGASDFLAKPFQIAEVGLRIKNLLTTAFLMSQLKDHNAILEDKVLERTRQLSEKNHELTVAKNKAEESDRRYRLLFNANKDSITLFYIDLDGLPSRFVNFNYAGAEILGYSRDELYELTVYDLECDLTPVKLLTRHKKLMANGMINFEATMRTKNGNHRYMEIKAVLIEIGGENTVMQIARDITERVEYIEAIQKQNKALREIAWTQSHIVRAPLARMMGALSLINDIGPDAIKDEDIVKIILQSGKDLDDIIRDISRKTQVTDLFDDNTPV